jgi:hypothetical protein
MEWFIQEKAGGDAEEQLYRNQFTSIRIGKVTSVLYENKPSELLPFKGKFPLVDVNDQKNFLDRTMKAHYFKDCPDDIKLTTKKAEKILFFHNAFCDYLASIAMSHADFKGKNPKTKQDILYDFLFANKLDIGILEI